MFHLNDNTLTNIIATAGAIWYGILFTFAWRLVRETRRRMRAGRMLRRIEGN